MINKTYVILSLMLSSILMFNVTAQTPYDDCNVYGNCRPISTTVTNVNYSTVNTNNSNFLQGFNSSDFGKINDVNHWLKPNYFTTVQASESFHVYSAEPGVFSFGVDESTPIFSCDGDVQECYAYQNFNVFKNVIASGNVTASYFKGDGSLLTGISADNKTWNQTLGNILYQPLENQRLSKINNVSFYSVNSSNTTTTTLLVSGLSQFNNSLEIIRSGNTKISLTHDGAGLVIDGNTSGTQPTISVKDFVSLSGTSLDTYGRMLDITKTDYALNAGNTKYVVNIQGRASTSGSQGLRAMQFDVRHTGTTKQTGALMAVGGQIYHTGTGGTTNSYAMFFQLYQDANSTADYFDGARTSALILDGRNGSVLTYAGFRDTGIDTEDGNTSSAYNFYGGAHQKDTGTLRNAYGIYLEKQSAGTTGNYQIYSAGGNVILAGGGNISADNFFDTTPGWDKSSAEALTAIKNISSKVDTKSGNYVIDHSTLPEIAKAKIQEVERTNCKIVCKNETISNNYDSKGNEVSRQICNEVCDEKVIELEGRSLGGMVTVQSEAIKELSNKVESLELELAQTRSSLPEMIVRLIDERLKPQ